MASNHWSSTLEYISTIHSHPKWQNYWNQSSVNRCALYHCICVQWPFWGCQYKSSHPPIHVELKSDIVKLHIKYEGLIFMMVLILIFNAQIYFMLHVVHHHQYEILLQFHLKYWDQEFPWLHLPLPYENWQIHRNNVEVDYGLQDLNEQLAWYWVIFENEEFVVNLQVDHIETNWWDEEDVW